VTKRCECVTLAGATCNPVRGRPVPRILAFPLACPPPPGWPVTGDGVDPAEHDALTVPGGRHLPEEVASAGTTGMLPVAPAARLGAPIVCAKAIAGSP